jgi:hypothetical protein
VAERVIDVLEAVEVEEEDGEEVFGVLARALDGELQLLCEVEPVRQPRQRVVEGGVVEPFFGALALGDVLELRDDVERLALRVADEGGAG